MFLCDTKVSSSPQCCSRCHPKRNFQRHVRFPISAWQFLRIQQLFLSVGHSTKEGSCFGCSVLPASDTCHFSLLFVWLLFLKKSTFTLRHAKAFLFCFSFLFIHNFDLKNSSSSHQASTNVQTIPLFLLRKVWGFRNRLMLTVFLQARVWGKITPAQLNQSNLLHLILNTL